MAAARSSTTVAAEALSLDAIMRQWFAVQVWSGREALSARHLRVRGYEVFLPCYREHRRWSDRIKKTDKALFAGYVFCRLETAALGKVATTPGVVRIVGNQKGPISVPTSEIEAIQRVVETRLTVEPWPFLHPGQPVRIEAGPLRGMEGVVLNVKKHHRLIISIRLLQRSIAVEMEAEWLSVPLSVLLNASP